MARRIARLGSEHVRVAVRAGHLRDPAEEERLVAILLGRRERILRISFGAVSPLADVTVSGDTLCAIDLARATGVAGEHVAYAARTWTHDERAARTVEPAVEGPRVCVRLPQISVAAALADDDPARYETVELIRQDGGKTALRAHVYDLGAPRGHVLAGIERP
jgi:hypothetical protein